ncbi:cadherin-related tumor suppressor, partial [Aplysia californica]|uniref:Cadherin-related tumor suppressor n=1 Tax=Aplysia californica TaxID=6500 RepID=A0ABM0ZXA8_APLCA
LCSTGALVINSALDREKVPNHTLIIQAQDGGSPHFSVQTSVVVQVSDDNDNAPIFSKLVYNKTLSEDTAVGTSLLRLLATDADEGFNGAVRYFIIGGEGSQDFHLDMSSGVLRVQKALDYERTTSYRLQVQAEDSSVLAPRHANATVVISVTDVNDFVPVFHDSPYKTYVQEGMPPGPVPVITVEAIDKDSGYNGIVKYSLRDLEDRGLKDLFQLEIDSGELTVLKPLDRETTPMYVLTVVAEDQGGRGLTGTATVTVLVKDVNDHSPVFESNGPYVAHVTENRVAGTEVVRVSAADGDEGQNAHILYSFHNNPRRHKFSIHPHTGQIVTTGQLDRELVSEYDLVVVATDQGIPPRSSSVNVTILVDDDNDHAPDFGTGRYSVIMYDSS